MTTKTLRFDSDVQTALEQAHIQQVDDEWTLDLVGQLDRKLYGKVKKAIQAMGGQWVRGRQTHVFKENPLALLGIIVTDGSLQVENLGFFPTPEPIIQQMIAGLDQPDRLARYLEPSAGEGAIALYLHRQLGVPLQLITCVEIQPQRAARLHQLGFPVYQEDFYTWEDYSPDGFDFVVMNPPFENDQAIKHILKAYDLLKPGGQLTSVVPGNIAQKDNSKLGRRFKNWISNKAFRFEQLPDNSFKEMGTGVQTGLLWVPKPLLQQPAQPTVDKRQLGLFDSLEEQP